MSETTADRQIVRAAGVVMVGFVLSSLTGLASQVLVSRAFSTNADPDAFFATHRLTEMIFKLMAGAALASAFLPEFIPAKWEDNRLHNQTIRILILALLYRRRRFGQVRTIIEIPNI